ncbi:MAG TPA: NAD(P)H-dependent oxidoreductase subunit E [Cytophagaceae bacterium]|jgi:NADH-quinone oxidoreductase subunit E|nr:NAD(P)H-dependent oxidoreductase subunit E [Cytophagaceae bacterium]
METVQSDIKFSPEKLQLAEEIMARYPEGRHKSALLPLLHIAQHEFGGWLSVPAMDYVASLLRIQPIEVYEVATFYSMYNLKPVGHCMIEFCQTGPCLLKGVEDVIDYTENKLGIKVGQTTPDGKFTLKAVECLGSCGTAPMAQIGEYYYENLTPEKIDKIVDIFSKAESNPDLKYEI